MWIFGGFVRGNDGKYEAQNDIWYSSDGTNWTKHSENADWSPRAYHNAIVFKDKIFIIGGHTEGFNYFTDVWYSSDGLNWTLQSDSELGPKGNMRQPGVFLYNNKLWLMGGNKNVWNYDE